MDVYAVSTSLKKHGSTPKPGIDCMVTTLFHYAKGKRGHLFFEIIESMDQGRMIAASKANEIN